MSLRKLPSLSIPEPPGLSHPGARGCHCCGQSPLAGQLQWPCCTPHSPLPSHTQFPHRFQPRVSDVLFGTPVYSWHRNTNTARGGIPQKTPPGFVPTLSVTLFLHSAQLLSIHLAGRHLSASPLFCYPNSCCASVHSPFLILFVIPKLSTSQWGAQPLQLNLHFRPTGTGFIHLSTTLGYFVMPQSAREAGEVLVVPQTWHGNRVLPVLVWDLGMFW